MRVLALLLASTLLLSLAPVASAAPEAPDVRCDTDDDLYNHCNVGSVHWVTGPGCVGVNVKDQPATCGRPLDVIDLTTPDVGCDIDDDLYNHCHVGPVHWVTGPGCAGVNVKDQPAACRELLPVN